MKNSKQIWLHFFGLLILISIINGCKKDSNSPGNSTNGKTKALFNPTLTYGTVTDQDGNTYKTIVIGTQTWMAENLRTTKYRNGDPIPQDTSKAIWQSLTSGAYCSYNNIKNADTIATYGRLYNWYTVNDSRDIAPTGWHVPSDSDWTVMTAYLGGPDITCGKLKETDTIHWISPNTAANNVTGFTALPGGLRGYTGGFYGAGVLSYWWSSTEYSTDAAVIRALYFDNINVFTYSSNKKDGFSVRCVKD